MFKIPKSFEIAGLPYTVRFVKEVADDPTINGMAYAEKRRIDILEGLDKEGQEQVFFHELTHQILDRMSEGKLSSNEKFVDLFSLFLHQSLKTMK